MTTHKTDTALPEKIGILAVIKLAWPIVVSMLSFTALIVVDSIFVAQLGTAPLAAIGLAVSVTFLILGFALGLIRGTKVVVAHLVGAGKHDQVDRTLTQGLILATGLGLVVAAFAPLGNQIFPLMGGSPEVVRHADAYFAVRVLGAPITFVLVALNAWFEGRGDTRTPMFATLLANGLNLALDPLLIFGWGPVPRLETAGAALATVISVLVAVIWVARRARRTVDSERWTWKIHLNLLRWICKIGLPMGTSRALEVGAWVIFTSLLARVSDIHLAAHVMVMRVVSVSFLPGYGIGEATGVFVGQALGARRPELARQAVQAGMRLAVAVMAGWAFVFVLFPEPLVAVFGAEAGVMTLACELMVVAALFQVFDALATIGIGALTGAGDTRWVMVVGVTSAWLVNLPLAWLLAIELRWGAVGAWLGLTVEILVIAIFHLARLRGETWLSPGGAPGLDEELVPSAT
ncbi:MAG: MATE family efflux transporter [Myxococcota bacterium]|nr:MATE family efflux transporter [Myxococcota bacterium]